MHPKRLKCILLQYSRRFSACFSNKIKNSCSVLLKEEQKSIKQQQTSLGEEEYKVTSNKKAENSNNEIKSELTMRNIKNYTTTTTTTNVEYDFSSGSVKISKVSTNRVVVSPASVSTKINCLNNLPLLSSSDLRGISQTLNSLNRNNQNILNHQQKVHFSMASSDNCGAAGKISGLECLHMKELNKGLAFSKKERSILGISGLLPFTVKTEKEQVEHCHLLLDRLPSDLDKYMYLISLSERNERLFYMVLASDISKMMPIVYTPTVGLACEMFSSIFIYPKGLYITIQDKGHIVDILQNWPENDIRAICVTDGERILGLGDLGANGMGIPVGKLSLYTALAGIKPQHCLPITLDVGTNTKSILDDPLYIGLRQTRVTGPEYDEFIDEFMQAVVQCYGSTCLIQFEDFGNSNAFRLLSNYRDSYCTFNDDIQGTAAVAVAGLLASLKIKNTKLKENTILFQGAGEAVLGIANLCVLAMMNEGLTPENARKRIWMVDSKGLIVKDRPAGGLNEYKLEFAHEHPSIDTLQEAVKEIKPTILIGAAAIEGAFTTEILQNMAELNEMPIIFALSNPTSKAECTAEQAYVNTKGKCIFASGSPFDPVEFNGKTFYPGQGNNSYIFPGVALGVICAGMTKIPEEVFLLSAKKLASLVTAEDLNKGSLYPPLEMITECSIQIATEVMDYAFQNGLATIQPEPADKIAYISSQMYNLHYKDVISNCKF